MNRDQGNDTLSGRTRTSPADQDAVVVGTVWWIDHVDGDVIGIEGKGDVCMHQESAISGALWQEVPTRTNRYER